MVLLGLSIGLVFKPQTASAVTTLTMLALSMVGGLWVPLDMMPGAMQTIGKLLPSYWAGQIGGWPLMGGAFPWRGVQVIAVWSVLLLGLGALSYRRAVRTSRRSN
jgi:ABC-2 type transport system permease protein